MVRKVLAAIFLLFILISISILAPEMAASESSAFSMVDQIDGHRIYSRDMDLENLTRSYLAYRSAGSAGANATADWIQDKFKQSGLDSWKESFDFGSWDLRSNASLRMDQDGDLATNDSMEMASFGPEQWSRAILESSKARDAVILPLPDAASRAGIGFNNIDLSAWGEVDTTAKVLFIGREVRWDPDWQRAFLDKIHLQRPAAIVLIWWYDWMKLVDVNFYSSSGGLPLGEWGPYFWNDQIPVGHLNFSESVSVKSMLSVQPSKAFVEIDSQNWIGTHSNVVGRINGTAKDSLIVVGAHYDSVLDPGFGDNGGGVTALIEIAKVLNSARQAGTFVPTSSIFFVAFAAEELGMVGSAEFVKAHQDQMKNVKAVVNLDCIGSKQLLVSSNDSSLGLKNVVLHAASDLQVNGTFVYEESSDHRSFVDPSSVNQQIVRSWGVDVGIEQATPVVAGVSILSTPLTYDDIATPDGSGWIHTDRDSYSTYGWMSPGELGNHTKVALLSITYLGGDSSATFALPLELITAILFAIVAAAAIVILFRRRPA